VNRLVVAIPLHMAPLQPAHENEGKPRPAPLGIAAVRAHMRAARHFRRIRDREQPLERGQTRRIERLNHGFPPNLCLHLTTTAANGLCNLEQRLPARHKYAVVTVNDRAMCKTLALQIERDLLVQKHLKTLLSGVGAALVERRRELRSLMARMAKDERK